MNYDELHDVSVKLQTTGSAPLQGRPHKKREYDFKAKADRPKRIMTGRTLHCIHITLSGQV
jgi:hypothetical protein